MARYVLSCSALFLVVCVYLATNQVTAYESTTSMCFDGMQVGDSKTYAGCVRCSCEEDGVACKGCPPKAPMAAPEGCKMERKTGNYPDCCEFEPVCP